MIAPSLPPALAAALDARMQGVSQNAAASRAQAISQAYRAGDTSAGIRSESDALAYAAARMPATYAAVIACFNAIVAVRPDFQPESLLDCGAGPGTATWAALEAFASLDGITMLDSNPALRALALDLMRETQRVTPHYATGDALAVVTASQPADLVIASYLIGEIGDAKRKTLTEALWQVAGDILLIVEPGTPTGYARILAARDDLIAQGAHVVAPCPHDRECPLIAPDWCHFAQRLPRTRMHRHLKGGALAYEDEKFSYVALTRQTFKRPIARVLDRPDVSKIAVTTKLCTANGLVFGRMPRRDKAGYAQARKHGWGDALS